MAASPFSLSVATSVSPRLRGTGCPRWHVAHCTATDLPAGLPVATIHFTTVRIAGLRCGDNSRNP